MKRILLIAFLGLTMCLGSYARKFVAEGNTYSALGKYRVEIDDNYVKLNGVEHKPYVITFENSDLEARVFVTMEKNCRKYYVISDNLSVQYVSTPNYFGVEKLDSDLEKEGYSTSDSELNRSNYFSQKVITGGINWRKDKTTLIAAYYPMLLNNQEALALASK
jgi:hypothetical protein